jgi:hypothetical protein
MADGQAPMPEIPNWIAELFHIQAQATGSVLLIAPSESTAPEQAPYFARLQNVLAQHAIPVRILHAREPLPSLLTYRRTRRIIRTTPTGGAVTYDVEEEVG